jgi:hypothetical protein
MIDTYEQDCRDAFGLHRGGMALNVACEMLSVDAEDVLALEGKQHISAEPSPATIAKRAATIRKRWSHSEEQSRANFNVLMSYADPHVEKAARFWASQRAEAMRKARQAV